MIYSPPLYVDFWCSHVVSGACVLDVVGVGE
jgi:hypothetical protein